MFFKVWFVPTILTIVLPSLCSGKVPLEQCPGESFEGLQERVQVNPKCGKSRCNLPKETNVTVTFRFTADKEVKTLTNDVSANIGGLPVPFIGVDGTDACRHVKRVDSDEYVSCPLAAGDYEYVNVFPILSLYPTLTTKVHWALKGGRKNVICFEIPAAITAPKKRKNNQAP